MVNTILEITQQHVYIRENFQNIYSSFFIYLLLVQKSYFVSSGKFSNSYCARRDWMWQKHPNSTSKSFCTLFCKFDWFYAYYKVCLKNVYTTAFSNPDHLHPDCGLTLKL